MSDRDRFLLSKHGESVTPESAAEGDADERWTEYADRPSTLRDVVSAFRECSELSCWPIPAAYARGVWGSTEAQQDMHSGAYESFSYHVKAIDGQDVRSRDMVRILRLAGHGRALR